MAKKNRYGKSTPINELIYRKIRGKCSREDHQLFVDLAFYTGERVGAIVQLQVRDIYVDPERRKLQEQITYRASTRKDGQTRQVPIHPQLAARLKAFNPPQSGWLFPGRLPGCHLGVRAIDRMIRRKLEALGLENDGFSTHGFRRGFITDLYNNGTDINLIASLTGHRSLQVVRGYIEISEEQRRNAIALR
ncbi:MAG: tyrosine-type recombinase/integrase [Leptolyngbyaceae bacterium]|nr:tyrosine-type recombinase/integrase [Leptolyngbyaceae bacterium]